MIFPPYEKKVLNDEEYLALYEESVTPEAIDIRVADMTNARMHELCDWMKQHGKDFLSVKEVDLGNNEIDGGEGLARLLSETKNAEEVDLRVNKIGKQGIFALQQSLMDLAKLRTLSLDATSLWDYGAEVVFNAAKDIKTLEELSLVDNYISSKGAVHAADFIAANTPLRELYLDYNKLGNDGANCIAEALKMNTKLVTLGINDNGIECDGCIGLGALFASNKGKLRRLDLSVNDIKAPGAKHLADGLAHNTTLNYVDLGANKDFSDRGAVEFTKCFRTNKTLVHIDLTNCFMTNEATDAMVANIKDNTTLLEMTMFLNEEMDMDHKQMLHDVYHKNRLRREEEVKEEAQRPPPPPAASYLKQYSWILIAFLVAVVSFFMRAA
eukprot:TRINITY_DN1591_c0_g1_i1.p1 TRINITY_DN1591_c0_g1~~TRINITY_DN1591_c0_g1_i1.p1  ORF type:complete len:383 (+),score=194.60 TRINITY_DN1591_c0_g1_i1:83-1231(+)